RVATVTLEQSPMAGRACVVADVLHFRADASVRRGEGQPRVVGHCLMAAWLRRCFCWSYNDRRTAHGPPPPRSKKSEQSKQGNGTTGIVLFRYGVRVCGAGLHGILIAAVGVTCFRGPQRISSNAKSGGGRGGMAPAGDE